MRIFVTGAGGFVGVRLVARLEAAGHDVTACDRDVDVTQPSALRAAFEKAAPEAVVHLAALSSVADSWRDPASVFRVNFLGTRSLLEAVSQRTPSARVLLVGSADQYAASDRTDALNREGEPLHPRSPYARSKAAAEQLGGWTATRGFDVVRVRAFNHTGSGQTRRFVASDFAYQVARIEAGSIEPVMRVGNLDSVRDFLHVDDVIDAYLRLLDRSVPAAIYNVASGVGVTVRSLLTTLCELAQVSPRIEVDEARFRPADYLVGDARRLQRATGWMPTIALRDTLAELLDFWRDRIAAGEDRA